MFPGKYTVKMNDVGCSISVEMRPAIIETGTVIVNGNGDAVYSVYDSTGKLAGADFTGKEVDLFPGKYTVKVSKKECFITIGAGTRTIVP